MARAFDVLGRLGGDFRARPRFTGVGAEIHIGGVGSSGRGPDTRGSSIVLPLSVSKPFVLLPLAAFLLPSFHTLNNLLSGGEGLVVLRRC